MALCWFWCFLLLSQSNSILIIHLHLVTITAVWFLFVLFWLLVELIQHFLGLILKDVQFVWYITLLLCMFIPRMFFHFYSFCDEMFIKCFDTRTAAKDIWKHSWFYRIIANTWTSHWPTELNIPHVNNTIVYMRAKEYFKWVRFCKSNLHFFFSFCMSFLKFVFVQCNDQSSIASSNSFLQLLLLSAFLSSCSEECFGAISVWGFWCFNELLWKKCFFLD